MKFQMIRFQMLLLLVLGGIPVLAQQLDKDIPIFDLELPNNSAFILLDDAPSTIQRPNSSRALGTTFLQNIASDGVLDNIAFEITPFWMSRNTKRSALKFYGVDKEKNQDYFSKLKFVSFSAAYVKDPSDIINISLGGRATLFELKRNEDVVAYFEAYHGIEKLIANIGDILEQEFDTENPIPTCENRETDEACRKEWEAYNKKLQEFILQSEDIGYKRTKLDEKARNAGLEERMQEVVKRKPALAIDLAAGYNHRYYNNEFNDNGFGRFGVWSTVVGSFFLNKKVDNTDYFNLYGFLRYLVDGDSPALIDSSDDRFNAIDLGVKAELEFNKLTIGYEYISRSGDLDGYRSAGSIRYQALENIYLTGAFGNNFEESDDLITLFGIQWGVDNPVQSVLVSD